MTWSRAQSAAPVQFAFLGPGFVAERRFVDAIRLLWRWPEGARLLHEAAAHGVRVVADDDLDAFASYAAREREIAVSEEYVESPTWMVADVLAHELRHAADRRAGRSPDTPGECVAGEQAAYRTERRFLDWLASAYGDLPGPAEVAAALSRDDRRLYRNLHEIAAASDVDAEAFADYRRSCAGSSVHRH